MDKTLDVRFRKFYKAGRLPNPDKKIPCSEHFEKPKPLILLAAEFFAKSPC
jgi:hypothetical protein